MLFNDLYDRRLILKWYFLNYVPLPFQPYIVGKDCSLKLKTGLCLLETRVIFTRIRTPIPTPLTVLSHHLECDWPPHNHGYTDNRFTLRPWILKKKNRKVLRINIVQQTEKLWWGKGVSSRKTNQHHSSRQKYFKWQRLIFHTDTKINKRQGIYSISLFLQEYRIPFLLTVYIGTLTFIYKKILLKKETVQLENSRLKPWQSS